MSCTMTKSFYAICNNKTVDQPVHPLSLISIFVAHCLSIIIALADVFIKPSHEGHSTGDHELAGFSLSWSVLTDL